MNIEEIVNASSTSTIVLTIVFVVASIYWWNVYRNNMKSDSENLNHIRRELEDLKKKVDNLEHKAEKEGK